MKKVLITGVTGQDGSNMVDYLLDNTDHDIFGMVRRSATPNYDNMGQALKNPRFKLVVGDLSDSQSIDNLVKEIRPDYFINLAAQSFVGASWQLPEQTFDVDAMGVIRCLEAIRKHVPHCRLYNAGSSEEFGHVEYSPQNENHPLRPQSPYGAAKCAARHIVRVYRNSYNLYAIQGYLFNHEGPRRGEEFVTRKITLGVARIKNAMESRMPFDPIELGNLDAKRDWSDAEDFVDGIWKMLNQEKYAPNFNRVGWAAPDQTIDGVSSEIYNTKIASKLIKEYVLSSNETHTIREFVELAFSAAKIGTGENELKPRWINIGDGSKPEDEVYAIVGDGYLPKGSNDSPGVIRYMKNRPSAWALPLVRINPKFYRPAEVQLLWGDSSLARKELDWKPKYSFNDLVTRMVENDLRLVSKKHKYFIPQKK